MIQDKIIRVKHDGGSIDMTITGEQLAQTVRRRMSTLMPKARILDLTEVLPDAAQHDLAGTSKARGGR